MKKESKKGMEISGNKSTTAKSNPRGQVSHVGNNLEGVERLQERSSDLKKDVLKKAANTLIKHFHKTNKSFFKRGLPSPFIRSKDSRPLHFTNDGKYLMYFTRAEFIKVELLSLKIKVRRKIPRADLSPLFTYYNIWSQDSSKVLVYNSRILNYRSNKRQKIYVYNTNSGEYTEISEKLAQMFSLPGSGHQISIESFNPTNSTQLIVMFKRPARPLGDQLAPAYLLSSGMYLWDFKRSMKR